MPSSRASAAVARAAIVAAGLRKIMAKASDYRIITFQRQPGLWRANMTPIVQPATITRGAAIRGFVTAEDSKSEEDAVIAANRAIRDLDA